MYKLNFVFKLWMLWGQRRKESMRNTPSLYNPFFSASLTPWSTPPKDNCDDFLFDKRGRKSLYTGTPNLFSSSILHFHPRLPVSLFVCTHSIKTITLLWWIRFAQMCILDVGQNRSTYSAYDHLILLWWRREVKTAHTPNSYLMMCTSLCICVHHTIRTSKHSRLRFLPIMLAWPNQL